MFVYEPDGASTPRAKKIIQVAQFADQCRMGKGSSFGSPVRWLAGLALIGAMWALAFAQDDKIPGLSYVNVGLHQLGHMLTYASSDVTNGLAGPIAQVAIPALLAIYFFLRRGDWVLAGVLLVWAATSALEVSLYVADAPKPTLGLLGDDQNDWALILGPNGYDVMEKAPSLADKIHNGATIAAGIGFLACLAAPLSGRRRQPEGTAAASRATAASS
jgi:hypothetical protein